MASSDGEQFRGIPPAAVDFYQRLGAENTKAFWQANRETYDSAVRGPLVALAEQLAPEFGEFHLFRPHRDVRFSKDKTPYKDHQGAVTEGERGEVYYVQIGAEGLFVATGYHQMARDQLERYRAAVDDDTAGSALETIVAKLGRSYEIGGSALSTAPRGYPRDHRRVELLRHKGVTASKRPGTPAWLATRAAVRRIAEIWRGASELNGWLNDHVGPSTLPPPEFGR